ncbi:hypothetical protein Sango_1039100 [Sesamum angolense]|uniref:DUF4283 domain-containing protein n=1 Tax=Sesamum angolense TaxID=2727404 RepID=A0AAE1X0B0_9LAMI|nr:hypothetical protein Sango_1039100 [Sesamum angolense]
MLNLVKGMEIRQLDRGKFFLRVNHIIDRDRAIEGCSWSFEKNVLMLSGICKEENPMGVNLDWYEFFIHVHDILLSIMNLGVATVIGNKLGRFRDIEMDDRCALVGFVDLGAEHFVWTLAEGAGGSAKDARFTSSVDGLSLQVIGAGQACARGVPQATNSPENVGPNAVARCDASCAAVGDERWIGAGGATGEGRVD